MAASSSFELICQFPASNIKLRQNFDRSRRVAVRTIQR
jgi:hypothetical protein